MRNKSLCRVGEQKGGEEGLVREAPGWPRKPARRWARVAESPGSGLSCCSQLRGPRASWMRAGGHGQGCLPDTHRVPFDEVAAVSLEHPLLPVALPAPFNNALPSAGLGKLRCTTGNPHSRGKGGNPTELEQGGIPAHGSENWALGSSFPFYCTYSTPLIASGHC